MELALSPRECQSYTPVVLQVNGRAFPLKYPFLRSHKASHDLHNCGDYRYEASTICNLLPVILVHKYRILPYAISGPANLRIALRYAYSRDFFDMGDLGLVVPSLQEGKSL